ncbi:Oxysterol-binding protein 4-like protein 1 [Seiridium cupressi]
MTGQSLVKDILQFLQDARGVDLATVTSPPFFLAPVSVVEVGSCWAERPEVFAAPAHEPSAEKRALLVLKWLLLSLKRQFYAGDVAGTGNIKKPLNAFLGELFIASWTAEHDDDGGHGRARATTNLVVEQISHHPPTTALYMWDGENGISAQAFSRVKMVFNTGLGPDDAAGLGIDISQSGYGTLHIDRFDEDHLIPAPRARVKGLLSGHLYPELVGTCHSVSSGGFVSEIRFSPPEDKSRGLFGWLDVRGSRERKNRFVASLYHRDDPEKKPLYTAAGQWSGAFSIRDERQGEIIETYNMSETRPQPAIIQKTEDMDPWETRRAWGPVAQALRSGDMAEAARQKSKLEKSQREMRSAEKRTGTEWFPIFFKKRRENDELFERLASAVKWPLEGGADVWAADEEKARSQKRPFRENVAPLGYSHELGSNK